MISGKQIYWCIFKDMVLDEQNNEEAVKIVDMLDGIDQKNKNTQYKDILNLILVATYTMGLDKLPLYKKLFPTFDRLTKRIKLKDLAGLLGWTKGEKNKYVSKWSVDQPVTFSKEKWNGNETLIIALILNASRKEKISISQNIISYLTINSATYYDNFFKKKVNEKKEDPFQRFRDLCAPYLYTREILKLVMGNNDSDKNKDAGNDKDVITSYFYTINNSVYINNTQILNEMISSVTEEIRRSVLINLIDEIKRYDSNILTDLADGIKQSSETIANNGEKDVTVQKWMHNSNNGFNSLSTKEKLVAMMRQLNSHSKMKGKVNELSEEYLRKHQIESDLFKDITTNKLAFACIDSLLAACFIPFIINQVSFYNLMEYGIGYGSVAAELLDDYRKKSIL